MTVSQIVLIAIVVFIATVSLVKLGLDLFYREKK